ncbi:MAG: tRNA epoxyqueuosine(34) reductase QueG [Gammaproteobacteria bacterium]
MDDPRGLAKRIKSWGRELGFQQVGITATDLAPEEARLNEWLAAERHGDMDYMARHGTKRSRPAELVPGTRRVIVVRLDYYPEDRARSWAILDDAERAFVSRYALGRDYHKVMRGRLQKLADRIGADVGEFGYRAFVDSAPVLEKPLARNAGLGWVGKHTNLLNTEAGSWFFLGVLYTDLELPVDATGADHCGSCRACIDVCPTQAIDAPYQLDARRCISYLTIENHGAIPEEFRAAMGNRIYGCDDCQLVCPWNKFATRTTEPDFAPRHALDDASLVDLFAWDEAQFNRLTEGSAIRRIGHTRWLRNIAVALGNAPTTAAVVGALQARAAHDSPLVREHVAWALARHRQAPVN